MEKLVLDKIDHPIGTQPTDGILAQKRAASLVLALLESTDNTQDALLILVLALSMCHEGQSPSHAVYRATLEKFAAITQTALLEYPGSNAEIVAILREAFSAVTKLEKAISSCTH